MRQPNIVIADYGIGNVDSIMSALRHLGYRRILLSSDQLILKQANAIILPGVGAFAECAANLRKCHLDKILKDLVVDRGTPMLGICVGMQLLADFSEEGGHHRGLGWIPGKVLRLQLPREYAVPHVGWNELTINGKPALFENVTNASPHFYFDHSYHYECDSRFVLATCDYPFPITAAIGNGHVYGVQFHPEKSQANGLRLFRAFFNAVDRC